MVESSPLDTAHHNEDKSRITFQLSMDSATEHTKDRGTKFGSISGLDDTMHGDISRVTGIGLSPTFSPGTGRQTSREDANLLLFLQDNDENGVYLHDMG